MSSSKALSRVSAHTYKESGVIRPRQEGIYLSLTDLDTLIDYCRSVGQTHVAFMIGKLDSSKGRKLYLSTAMSRNAVEYTVEVLPFQATVSGGPISGATFLTISGIEGSLTIPDSPFDNEGGGGGGSQKTPPPSAP